MGRFTTKRKRKRRNNKTRRRRSRYRGGNPEGQTTEQPTQLSIKRWRANMTPEEHENLNAHKRSVYAKRIANLAPEQLAEHRQKKINYMTNWRANLAPEQLAEHRQKKEQRNDQLARKFGA